MEAEFVAGSLWGVWETGLRGGAEVVDESAGIPSVGVPVSMGGRFVG